MTKSSSSNHDGLSWLTRTPLVEDHESSKGPCHPLPSTFMISSGSVTLRIPRFAQVSPLGALVCPLESLELPRSEVEHLRFDPVKVC